MPLPETSVRTTSRVRPPLVRAATTKSPEKDWPPAGRSAISRCQPCGSCGSLLCTRMRSRRSKSMVPPRRQGTPTRLRNCAISSPKKPQAATTRTDAGGDPGRALGVRAEQHRLDDQCGRRRRVQAQQARRAAAAGRRRRSAGPARPGRTTPASASVPAGDQRARSGAGRPARSSRSRRRGSSRRRPCARRRGPGALLCCIRAVNVSAAARRLCHCSGPYPSPLGGGPTCPRQVDSTVTNCRAKPGSTTRSRGPRWCPGRHGVWRLNCGCCGTANGTSGTATWIRAFGGVAGAAGGARAVECAHRARALDRRLGRRRVRRDGGGVHLPAHGAGRRRGAGGRRHDGRAWPPRTGGAGC